jgi:hypothetical protein
MIVVNLANLPINSATSNAGFEYSVHNAISPKHFYIHDTVPGTYYDLRVRWTFGSPAYESDISTVAMMIGGTALSLLGLALAPFTAGLSIQAGAVVYQAIGGGMALGLAMAKGAVPLAIALGADSVKWIITDQKVKEADDIKWTNVKGADTTIFVIRGTVPIESTKTVVVDGKEHVTEISSKDPNLFPLQAEKLDEEVFNRLRSRGELTQSRIPILADLNILLGTLDAHAYTCNLGADSRVSTNKRYWIRNYHPDCPPGILGANSAEGDKRFYRTPASDDQTHPENHWQLVPYLNLAARQGGNDTGFPLNVFALAERRYGKFLTYDIHSRGVEMRDALSMQELTIAGDERFHYAVDFTGTTWEAKPRPYPKLRLRSRSGAEQSESKLGWTPYFAIIPGRSPGYFYITPYLPKSPFSTDLNPAFYSTMRDKGPFISADSRCGGTNIWILENHPSDAMDQWQFAEVNLA